MSTKKSAIEKRKQEGVGGNLLAMKRISGFLQPSTIERLFRQTNYSADEEILALIELARDSDKPSIRISAMNALNTRVTRIADRALRIRQSEEAAAAIRERTAILTRQIKHQHSRVVNAPPRSVPASNIIDALDVESPVVPDTDAVLTISNTRKDTDDSQPQTTEQPRPRNACVIAKPPTAGHHSLPESEGSGQSTAGQPPAGKGHLHASLRGLAYTPVAQAPAHTPSSDDADADSGEDPLLDFLEAADPSGADDDSRCRQEDPRHAPFDGD